MHNNEATAHGKLNLKSLPICWLIILGGYLLIRMVFLVFGLQLHLTAQGICLALLPYCFGALYLWRCCKNREPLFYALGILLPAIVEKLTLYFLGAYLCGVSPFRVTAVMEAIGTIEPYAVRTMVNIRPPADGAALERRLQAWMRHAQAMLFAIMAMWRCMTEKEKS